MADIMKDAKVRMDQAVEHAKEEFGAIRTGRAHPAMFAKIVANAYGQDMPLQQLASVQVVDARMVLITPFDRGTLHSVEKAIRDSDLGVNPATDGHAIRVSLPELTEERRKEYTKLAKHKAEDSRVAIRNVRRHAKDHLDKLVKDKEAGEDEVARAEKELETLTKGHTDRIDELLKNKEAELLEV
ncbi:ribosome recycling factor [Granulicoccus sp. GXG6511]|uniref:ribosome recycling factor n=1 Tax=Granulicoccus sp. GXG6511 TaxID=3381351 RepID=UPI003D7DD24B